MWWLLSVGLGCPRSGPEPEPVDPIVFVDGPTVSDNPGAGLTAWLEVGLDEAAPLEIDIAGPDRTATVTSPAGTDHRVLLLGLHADEAHQITVRAVDDQGRTRGVRTVPHTPPPLPETMFTWEMGPADLARSEPGVTLVGLGDYLVAIDPQGHPVWYAAVRGAIHEATRLQNGNLVVLVNRTSVTEMALDGTVVAQWRAGGPAGAPPVVAVDVEALHHDVMELPDGNLVSLSIERRWIEDYPSSETDPDAPPAPAWVAGDVVVEFDRAGVLLASWPLLDRLDPRRVAYDAIVGNYWEDFGPWVGDDIKDWSHGNAVSYDAATNTILVGMRHQDAVAGLSRETGALQWILAPANWSAELAPYVLAPEDADTILPYHMHGAKFTPDGTVMLFDNGNNRASAYEPPLDPQLNFSRALEVELDLEAMTWREVWSYGEAMDPPHYAGSLGDADPLPLTGNVLITFGNVADPELGGVRLLEVTRGGEPVWDLVVPFATATTFRSQRITGMIPGL